MPSGIVTAIVLLAAALGSAGCTPAMQAARDTAIVAFRGPPPIEVTREAVFSRPYYQLRLDSALGSAVLVLARVTDGQQFWVASTGHVVVIENGLVRRIIGFPETLEGTRVEGADPFAAGLHRVATGTPVERTADWMPGYRFGAPLHGRFEPKGRERVEILGEGFDLLRVDEHLASPSADFEALNHYWVDPSDGTVLKSEQQVTPSLRLVLTALRPWRPEGQR